MKYLLIFIFIIPIQTLATSKKIEEAIKLHIDASIWLCKYASTPVEKAQIITSYEDKELQKLILEACFEE